MRDGLFSTTLSIGYIHDDGSWARYFLDKTGLMLFGYYWRWIASLGIMVGAAWSLRVFETTFGCCCSWCCRRNQEAGGEARRSPVVSLLARLARPQGYLRVDFVGPTGSRDVDAEYYKKQVRGRGLVRKPQELILRIAGEAARLQPDSEFSSRIDRHGLVVKYSRVVGATSRVLREQLEARDRLHLCRHGDCPHGAELHCSCYAAVGADALVDLGSYGGFTALRCGVPCCRGLHRLHRALWWGISLLCVCCFRGAARISHPRIHDQGVLRVLDPDSESETEALDDPCQAIRVGLLLQGAPRALSTEECKDRAAVDPTRLLECDRELSDLGALLVFATPIASFTSFPAKVGIVVCCRVLMLHMGLIWERPVQEASCRGGTRS